jgi:hypothetical protein
MLKLFSVLILLFVAGSVQAHEDPLQVPWPKGEKVPCRCDILAMPYELCLKGIGAEECFKVKEVKEPKCSPHIAPGSVVLTNPPTYNCEDLKKKQSVEKRIAEIEAQLKEIKKILVTKIESNNWKLMLDK